MLAGVRAIAAALAMVSVSFAAVAQVVPPGAQIVPPSDQPGRERERFEHFGGVGTADEWWSTIFQSLPSFT